MPLFDALVDGNVSAELSLAGKPEPDIMLETSRRVGVDPGEAILFEDALSGVQAGRAAAMGLVVGVARDENHRQLRQGGADLVVDDLSQIRFLSERPRSSADLGSAIEALDDLRRVIAHVRQTAIFLDYDGTLTPIVERPELAKLDDVTRSTVSRLAEHHLVAVISGRDLTDVRFLVDLDNLYYAGSHGFEIAGPGNMHSLVEQGEEYLPVIDKVDGELHDRLDDIEGVLIERKRLSVAVHFRLASTDAESDVSDAVDKVVSHFQGLRRSEGKKVIEVQPDIDWHKGKAVEWLMQRLEIDPSVSLVVYIGDDLTDEDAFRSLRGRGLSILVRDPAPRDTYADLAVDDPAEVRALLQGLIEDDGGASLDVGA
jgi:alpha,alpha-trehalase